MINKGNLNEYQNNDDLAIFEPANGGWSNGMQIPTTTPPIEPQMLIWTEGSLNFKQVSVPSGFVYHKITIPTNTTVYNGIVHTSIKLNNNDSFVYADTPTKYEIFNSSVYEYPGRHISEVGIAYNIYPHIVLRLEFLNTYYTYDRSGTGTTIPNGGINFNISGVGTNIKAVLVEIFIELDIRNLLNIPINNFFRRESVDGYNTPDTNEYWSTVIDIDNWLRNCIITNANKKAPIRLFGVSLNDILNRNYVNFIGANIINYTCTKTNDVITSYNQINQTSFNNKNSFLQELNKTGTANDVGDGNFFYIDNNTIVNIYNGFHMDSNTSYNCRGIFNYRDIENNINDTYQYDNGETIDNYVYYIDNEETDSVEFLEAVALSLMRYHELFNSDMFITHDVNDLSLNTYKSLINKLSKLETAENDILWGKGVNILRNGHSIVSTYTFKKNKITLKVRK